MHRLSRLLPAAIFALVLLSPCARADANPPDDGAAWASIRKDVFGQREITDGAGAIALEAPERAEDAAVVPITIRLAQGFASKVQSLTLVIDENPSPIAATFRYGEAAGDGERIMATRIRVDRYTFVRAIAETTDGRLYMARAFIKASGGCSAPASRDAEEAEKSLGKMRIKAVASSASGGRAGLAEVMIRHPNISGMAIDQLSGGYPPARFISKLSVTVGSKLIFAMDGGISISEDPHFRFSYRGAGGDLLSVVAEDSMGTRFDGHSGNPS